jgi:hypothetical protein
MLDAAVGMHVVHPYLHRHDAGDCCETHRGGGERGARVAATEASEADVHARACPVCRFLAAFHAPVPTEAAPAVLHDKVFASVFICLSVPCPHDVRGVHHSRAPPSPFAEPGFSDGKRFLGFARNDTRDASSRIGSA